MEENHLFLGRYAKISTDDRGLYFFTEGRRPEVKKYNPRSEVDHLSMSTDKEVVLLHNFDFPTPLRQDDLHGYRYGICMLCFS